MSWIIALVDLSTQTRTLAILTNKGISLLTRNHHTSYPTFDLIIDQLFQIHGPVTDFKSLTIYVGEIGLQWRVGQGKCIPSHEQFYVKNAALVVLSVECT